MSYVRVIPRDLFNEANLLKCYGQIYLNLETTSMPHVVLEHDGDAFIIEMDDSSGATFVANITLTVNGDAVYLQRPCNSRLPWPLLLVLADETEIEIFDDDGSFSADFIEYMQGQIVPT